MENQKMIVMLSLLILVLAIILFVLSGCTSFDPKNDKNVYYTFETVSYESPNSPPSSAVNGLKPTLKLPKL